LRAEVIRKALHGTVAIVPIAYARVGVSRDSLGIVLASASGVALVIELTRRVVPRIQSRFESAFGNLLRPHEHRHITGATWLALSCLVAVALLPREAAIAALWCATAGDAVAALFGRVFGAGSRAGKTYAGSTAFLAVSVAGIMYLTAFRPIPGLIIALAGMVAERIASRIDDNVAIAAISGIAAWSLF
jgi:dolichol kinase